MYRFLRPVLAGWRRVGILVVLCLMMAAPAPARAEAAGVTTPLSAPQISAPQTAEVGVWLNGVHSIDFVNGSFGAEFYMWWISPDEAFRPFELFQVLNGRQWTVRSQSRRKLPDGAYHTSGIVSVTVSHDWELENFPFDSQSLRVIVETSQTAAELKLVPDTDQSTMSNLLHLEGYNILGLRLEEKTEKYQTNFGIEGASADQYSRLIMTIDITRESGRLIVAVLIGFIVANIIALMTFAIHVSALSIRATMVGSAIFAAVGNMYSLNSVLNPAIGSLLVDRIAVGTFAAIVAVLLNSILAERLDTKGRSSLAHKLNRNAFYVIFAALAVYYGLTFAAAMAVK